MLAGSAAKENSGGTVSVPDKGRSVKSKLLMFDDFKSECYVVVLARIRWDEFTRRIFCYCCTKKTGR